MEPWAPPTPPRSRRAGTGTRYTWSISAGSLPAGLTLSAGGTITGTPTASGTSNCSRVADSGSASATASKSIAVNRAVSITSGNLPNGTVGTPYSATLAASRARGTGYTLEHQCRVAARRAALKPGLISGTPTASGTSNFTVRVADSGGASATASKSIAVNGAVSITPRVIFLTEPWVPYSATLAASGGTGTGYTWSISAGTLPAGLTLSAGGRISGTPRPPGPRTLPSE